MIRGVCVYRAREDRPEELTRWWLPRFSLQGLRGGPRSVCAPVAPARRGATQAGALMTAVCACCASDRHGASGRCEHSPSPETRRSHAERKAVAVPVTVVGVVVRAREPRS